MERVREIAALNEKDFDPMDIKTLLPGLESWLRASPLVQSMQTICAHDGTQLRFWLPAQCIKDGQEKFEEHLKRGFLVVPIPPTADVEWSKGALTVECCVISTKNVTDFPSAKVVRLGVRVYPQCAQCACVFDTTAANRLVCGGCKVPFYCNVDCQTTHWPAHKPKCQLLRQTAGPTTTAKKEKE